MRLILRSDNFYNISTVPYEIISHYSLLENFQDDKKTLKEISIDHLKDVHLLEKYIKMCCFLGCSKRKQFEEEFTTLLLLLNQDTNFEDPEDQFRFKQLCLNGMISFLILSCYRCSLSDDLNKYFYHSSRFENFYSKHIGLQKLKINQIVTNCQRNSAFNDLNLEKVKFGAKNSSILTESFGRNQFNLDFVWQQSEEGAGSSLMKENMSFLLGRTGIDMESFMHLIYDVCTELMKVSVFLESPKILN